MDPALRFTQDHYTLRRKVLTIAGAKFHIYGPDDALVLFAKLKAFKIREDIRLYSDESMSQELLRIQTKSIWDIAGTYGVFDVEDNQTIGGIKRQALKSMMRDEWQILDAGGNPIATIREDSTLKALARRFFDGAAMLMPQKYHAEANGREVATFKQNFNPIVQKLELDFSMDTQNLLDPRLGIAAAVLLGAIEGRQN